MRLEGKVALITGAANGVKGELMGMGGAAAWLFASEGAKVVLCDIDETAAERSASQIRESGGQALFVRLDVAREREWIHAIERTVSEFGRLDILVNCAGNKEWYDLEDTTEEVWDGVMDSHAKGTLMGMKHAVPEMRKVGGGSIVNISSILGIVGSSSRTSYVAAKGAIQTLTKAVAVQYAKDSIRVNSLHPGTISTPRSRDLLSDPEVRSSAISRIPLGRPGTAEDIAQAILYLASDESSFVTGAELIIDGGEMAQ